MVLLIGMTRTLFEGLVSEEAMTRRGLAVDSARLGLAVAAMCFRSFPTDSLDPLWPRDPAQSPDLFCQLEARLADGHRNAEQTKTIPDGPTALACHSPVLPDSRPDVLQPCLCSFPDRVSVEI